MMERVLQLNAYNNNDGIKSSFTLQVKKKIIIALFSAEQTYIRLWNVRSRMSHW